MVQGGIALTKKLVFPSEEWIAEYWKLLNANTAYKDAAKDWEGAFLFVIEADGKVIKENMRLYMDLWHGECRLARMALPDDKAPFVYAGPYENWKQLFAGKIDPIKGIMARKFKLTGDMGKVMRATKAAAELVATAVKIPTKFLDE
ncbi:MAG: SCP2 sterol-binding domain-containing protein [Candidatus Thorarchaeota archaeon]|nr:SCP2 sterol-binding domain-containing protein [Candidatus Thorarchaeota archaeon]